MIAAVENGTHPPMTTVLHLHAVLMGAFLLLLLAQTWLAATGRIKGHMQLGLTALVLVPALVIVGTMLAAESYRQVAEVAASAAPDLRAAAEATVLRKENILLSQLRAGVLFPYQGIAGDREQRVPIIGAQRALDQPLALQHGLAVEHGARLTAPPPQAQR